MPHANVFAVAGVPFGSVSTTHGRTSTKKKTCWPVVSDWHVISSAANVVVVLRFDAAVHVTVCGGAPTGQVVAV